MAQVACQISPLPAPSSCLKKRHRLLFEDRPSSTQVLERLLELIDDTVLPRRLRLLREGRVLACFIVAHRKLLSVEIEGQPVAAGDAASCAAQFARALNRLVQLSPSLAPAGAKHSPLPQFDVSPCRIPETTARCSAAQLGKALLDITAGHNPAPSVLDCAMSWARTDQTGTSQTLGGDPHFHDMLVTALGTLLRAHRSGENANLALRTSAMPLLQILPLQKDVTLVTKSCPNSGHVWVGVFAPDPQPAPDDLLAASLI